MKVRDVYGYISEKGEKVETKKIAKHVIKKEMSGVGFRALERAIEAFDLSEEAKEQVKKDIVDVLGILWRRLKT